jgi:hypothetical protein
LLVFLFFTCPLILLKKPSDEAGYQTRDLSGNSQQATYCATEATSSQNLKFFIIFFSNLTILFLLTVTRFFDTVFLHCWGITKLLDDVQIKSLPYWEDSEKLLSKLQTEKFAYQKMRILNIFIGSEAESSELFFPTKNRIENDRLGDEKPSNQS